MFIYIFKDTPHSDTSREYMLNLGMNTETIESVLAQQQFEAKQNVELRQQAYKRESDPLYIEWQKEVAKNNPDAEMYKQKWLDKTDEIYSRFS
ncbi:hypothetical protein ACBH03_000497 [Vibrio vulnificus]